MIFFYILCAGAVLYFAIKAILILAGIVLLVKEAKKAAKEGK